MEFGSGLVDRAPREAELEGLRQENMRLRRMLRSAVDYAIVTMDIDGFIDGWNSGAQSITGYAAAEVMGRSGEIILTAEDRRQGRFTLELCRALENGRAQNERWHLRHDGTRFWASGLMIPLLDDEGQAVGFVNVLRDRSDAHAEDERRELLMAEMNHGVKNILATVQAVASQTSRHAAGADDFKAAFASRLRALARSHDMLMQGGWPDAPLRDVVEGALDLYGREESRATVEGTSVMLAANMVVALTLAFHELATNAAKHGSLSVPGGSVKVSWAIKPAGGGGRHAELVWREQGGPVVAAPSRHGFGSQLLQTGLVQFGGSLQLDFQPAGLVCHMRIPLGAVTPREVARKHQARSTTPSASAVAMTER